jgi:hypothetical protein
MVRPSSAVPNVIAVQVDLPPPLDAFADGRRAQDVRARFQAHAEDLVDDLRIPATLALTLTRAPAIEAMARPPYRIIVNGRSCRVPVSSNVPVPESAAALAGALAWHVCRNRTLLLTPAITTQLRAEWSAQADHGTNMVPVEMLHHLLSELITRAVRIDIARPIATSGGDTVDAMVLQRLLEDHLSSSSTAPRVGVVLSSDDRDRLGTSSVAPASGPSNESVDQLLGETTDRLYGELGLLVPEPTVTWDHRLDAGGLRVQLNALRWPPVHQGATAATAGIIADTVLAVARDNAASLLTTDVVNYLLDRLHQVEPALVAAADRRFDATALTWILRDLLEEQISIRDVRNLLESLLSLEGNKSSSVALGHRLTSRDVTFWADWIRSDFQRQITHRYGGATGSLAVYLIASELEARIATIDVERVSDDERHELLQPLYACQAQDMHPLQILTSLEVKRPLRKLIAHELPEVAVLAYQELDPATTLTLRGRIGDAAVASP